MTDHHDLKVQIRERMASEKETYTEARRHILGSRSEDNQLDSFILGKEQSTPGADLVVVGSPKPSLVFYPNLSHSRNPTLILASPEVFQAVYPLRAGMGPVFVYDPYGALPEGDATNGYSNLTFSPLTDCFREETVNGQKHASFDECWKSASWLSEGITSMGGGTQDWEYWASSSRQLLTPLFYAAALTGKGMTDVIGWVHSQDLSGVLALLKEFSYTSEEERDDINRAFEHAKGIDDRPDKERGTVFSTTGTLLGFLSLGSVRRTLAKTNFAIDDLLVSGATTFLIQTTKWDRYLNQVIVPLINHITYSFIGQKGLQVKEGQAPLRIFLLTQDSLPLGLVFGIMGTPRKALRVFLQLEDMGSLAEGGKSKILRQLLQQHEVLLLPGSITTDSLAEVLSALPLDRLPKISPAEYSDYLIPLEGHPKPITFD